MIRPRAGNAFLHCSHRDNLPGTVVAVDRGNRSQVGDPNRRGGINDAKANPFEVHRNRAHAMGMHAAQISRELNSSDRSGVRRRDAFVSKEGLDERCERVGRNKNAFHECLPRCVVEKLKGS
jgi:hypothetical protein